MKDPMCLEAKLTHEIEICSLEYNTVGNNITLSGKEQNHQTTWMRFTCLVVT